MQVRKLAHYSIRSFDLEKSSQFYEKVLGFTPGYRPPFDFPGVWLYMGGDEQDFGTVHIIGIDPANPEGLKKYLGDKDIPLKGTGTVDHIAFLAEGLTRMMAHLDRLGVPARHRTVPAIGLHQMFLDDPSGVVIELNYPAAEAVGVTFPA